MSIVPDRLKQAWKDYSEAVKLDPKFAPAYVGLFKVRMGQWACFDDRPADADANLRVAATNLIKIAPNLAETKLASGFLKYLDGHLGAAVADARQAATKMPLASKGGAGLVHGVYGWFLLNAGSADDALRELLLAKQATAYDPRVLHGIGDAYFVKHQFPQAFEYYSNSIDQEPRQYWGYFGKGSVYEETGEFEKAIEQFELGDRMVGRTNAQTKLFYDDLRKAVKRDPAHGYWEERLKQLSSGSWENNHEIAVALAHLGRMPEAYDRLERASDKGRLEGLYWDQCWDHNNEQFKRIAATVGMKP